jgi:hypothetical protein
LGGDRNEMEHAGRKRPPNHLEAPKYGRPVGKHPPRYMTSPPAPVDRCLKQKKDIKTSKNCLIENCAQSSFQIKKETHHKDARMVSITFNEAEKGNSH